MSKTLKILILIICLATLVTSITLAGCKKTTETTAAVETTAVETTAAPETTAAAAEETTQVEKEKVTIGVAMVDVTNPFFVDVMKGGDQVAAAMGAEVIWKSAEGSLEKQIAVVENFIQQKVDAIFIDPLDPVAIKPVIEKALKAGIPTLTAANLVEVPGNISTPFPAKDAFKMLMDMTAAYLNSKGDILYMSGIPGNQVLDQYLAGIVEQVKEYPDIKLLSEQPAKMDPALAQKIMENWLTAYSKIDAVIFTTDPDMYAAIESMKNVNRLGEFPLFSQNGDIKALEMIKNNENNVKIDLLSGATRIGALNMTIAIKLANGEKLPAEIWFGYVPVMTQETWDAITANGYKQDTEYKKSAQWITPEKAIEIVNNADKEFVNWTPPAQ